MSLSDSADLNCEYPTDQIGKISLNNKGIQDSGLRQLADFLQTNPPNITLLELWLNRLKAEGAKCLCDALVSNTWITAVHIQHNSIGDMGARYFAQLLRNNSSIQSLNLEYNDIREMGATELAEALKTNQVLTSLMLGGNVIGDQGAKRLGEMLKVNKTLKQLKIIYNNIADEGVVDLAEALINNVTLDELNLQGNRITDSAVDMLIKGAQKNVNIRYINLFQNQSSEQKGALLTKITKGNIQAQDRARLFSLMVLLSDDYLQLKSAKLPMKSPVDQNSEISKLESTSNSKRNLELEEVCRFFNIAKGLPLELQMHLSNVLIAIFHKGYLQQQFVLSRFLDHALRKVIPLFEKDKANF